MKQLLNIRALKKLILGFFLYLPLLVTSIVPAFANNDLLNQAYDEAKRYDYIVNPGNDKKAVGAQLFNSSVNVSLTDNLWRWCFKWPEWKKEIVDIKSLYCKSIWWFAVTKRWCYQLKTGEPNNTKKNDCLFPLLIRHDTKDDQCLIPTDSNFTNIDTDKDLKPFCASLWYDYNVAAVQVSTSEPYLVRLTKLILRITIAISVSIIIFAGISYILAFGDAAKQKKAQNIVIYALGGIFIWLSSLAIVELALSITKSSLKF